MVEATASNLHNPFGFTGYQHDNISGLQYAQARYYAPTLGRFAAEDVIKGHIVAPVSLNAYTYCWNQPISYYDLDGLCRQCARNYMERYGRPNEDGYSLRNPNFPDFSGRGGNCANFVSQALLAGGVSQIPGVWQAPGEVDTWMPNFGFRIGTIALRTVGIIPRTVAFNSDSSTLVTTTWVNAEAQFNHFSNPDNGFINGNVITINRDNYSMILDHLRVLRIQAGDLLFMDTRGTGIHHATIISSISRGNILLAGNSADWFDESLRDLIANRWHDQDFNLFLVRLNNDVFGECDC
jgi:RHS repeat-associated protein